MSRKLLAQCQALILINANVIICMPFLLLTLLKVYLFYFFYIRYSVSTHVWCILLGLLWICHSFFQQ